MIELGYSPTQEYPMSQFQMNLPDAVVEFAGAQVASGRFSSVSDYVIALVQADQFSQDELESIWKSPKLEKLLEEGIQSGPRREWNSQELARLKQQVLDRAAENRP
jgi:putative addiction module CopG family antidote